MPRGQLIRKKKVVLDPRYKSPVLEKFITRMMLQGKKNTATHIIYGALDIVTKKVGKDAVEVFQKALDNVKPVVEVKSRRVGGATLQVPVEIREERRDALGMRWLISFSRGRKGRSMAERLSAELIDAYNNTGSAVKKKEDTHKMAEANKAFAHYRW
ncbi:MAG: 30S ribosomal protein S7 [Spirochaetes bacterium]|jgi:small subunit ribosomal protein S7|nr:30S ribosomal protein S7 [Spirochaetota bacterium]